MIASGALLHIEVDQGLGAVQGTLDDVELVGGLSALGGFDALALALFGGVAEQARNQSDGTEGVVVGRDRIRDPGGIRVRVDHADGRDREQAALVQQHFVLQRVHAHDQVGPHHLVPSLRQHLVVGFNLLVVPVDRLHRAPTQDLLSVGQCAWHPAVEDMVALGFFRGADDDVAHPVPRTDKQDDTAAFRDLFNHFRRPFEVCVRDVERDDVDAVSYASDVAAVGRVPQRCGVAQMGLVGQEHGKGELVGGGWVCNVLPRVVAVDVIGTPAFLGHVARKVSVQLV